MSEQKSNPIMSLDGIKNIEPIDDLGAELVNAGSFKVLFVDNQNIANVGDQQGGDHISFYGRIDNNYDVVDITPNQAGTRYDVALYDYGANSFLESLGRGIDADQDVDIQNARNRWNQQGRTNLGVRITETFVGPSVGNRYSPSGGDVSAPAILVW